MDAEPFSRPIRSADLAGRRELAFAIEADAPARARVAAALGLLSLDDLRLTGVLRPAGRRDVALSARLKALAAQACVVTLAPVPAAVDVAVERVYVAGLAPPESGETEMPEDDRVEPLPEAIDLGALAVEALALALPDYPRAPGAALGRLAVAPPGAAPLTDDDLRPFAGLGALRDRGGDGRGDHG